MFLINYFSLYIQHVSANAIIRYNKHYLLKRISQRFLYNHKCNILVKTFKNIVWYCITQSFKTPFYIEDCTWILPMYIVLVGITSAIHKSLYTSMFE
jgi:hypothetical protein